MHKSNNPYSRDPEGKPQNTAREMIDDFEKNNEVGDFIYAKYKSRRFMAMALGSQQLSVWMYRVFWPRATLILFRVPPLGRAVQKDKMKPRRPSQNHVS